ncbi:MAG: amidohydrolase family protein [Verrucomicrobiales bacterium]
MRFCPISSAIAALALVLSLGGSALANLNVPPPPQEKPILLRGADVYPVSSEPLPGGQILFEGGKISNVAAADVAINLPAGTIVIEVAGKRLYPGLIHANSVLGLVEIRAVRATDDLREPGAINPNAKAITAINPDSELLPVTRANGVLTALSVPQTGSGGLAGQSAVINLDGWTPEQMAVRAPAAIHLDWPGRPRSMRFTEDPDDEAIAKAEKDHREKIERLRRAFEEARAYRKAKDAGEDGIGRDARWEGLLPALKQEIPVFIHANDAAQIREACAFAEAEQIRIGIVGGLDAWKVAPLLNERGIPVIVSPVNSLPMRRHEGFDTALRNPALLHEAGVAFCIADAGSSFAAPNARNLPYEAARAAAHGLPPEEALKAITLYPAKILGVSHRLGSLEPGKDATFILTDGDPLEVRTHVERAFVLGREIDLSSRHTRLRDKYEGR